MDFYKDKIKCILEKKGNIFWARKQIYSGQENKSIMDDQTNILWTRKLDTNKLYFCSPTILEEPPFAFILEISELNAFHKSNIQFMYLYLFLSVFAYYLHLYFYRICQCVCTCRNKRQKKQNGESTFKRGCKMYLLYSLRCYN